MSHCLNNVDIEKTAVCQQQYRFFHLDLVYFDPEELVFEVVVAGELVPVLYIFAFWDFGKDSCFSTSE